MTNDQFRKALHKGNTEETTRAAKEAVARAHQTAALTIQRMDAASNSPVGSRCPICCWALYDGAWCQNKDCQKHGKTIPRKQRLVMNDEQAANAIARMTVVLVACLALSACSTLAPKPVVSHAASWDVNVSTGANVQNSGLIHADEHGFHVTDMFLQRYDAMAALYGNKLVPPLKSGGRVGIVPESPSSSFYTQGARWVFDVPAHARFRQLNQLRKADVTP